MSENTQPESTPPVTAAPTPAAAPKKPVKSRLVRVLHIKANLSPPDDTGDEVRYSIPVVTTLFKEEQWPCTQQVYQWAQTNQPWLNVRCEWTVTVDPNQNNLVTNVTPKEVDAGMPGFTKVAPPTEPSKYVVVRLNPDGTGSVVGIPDRCGEAIASEIQNAVMDHSEPIHSGTKVGRFIVHSRSEVPGATEIHVDPMPR